MVEQIVHVIVFQWSIYLEIDGYPLELSSKTRSLSAFANDIGHRHTN
jgi:hypothetical protein